jgi:D-lactate dehydrogenase
MLKKLMSLPNVLITPHQAFATREALQNIAATTFYNFECWMNGWSSPNELPPVPVKAEVYGEDEES